MPFVIEHYNPTDDKHYTARAGNKEAAEQFKQVLEHLGMKEVTVFEEPETKMPSLDKEYQAGLKKLEEKKKEVISRYQKVREEYYTLKRELNGVYKEIEEYKERFGIIPNVR